MRKKFPNLVRLLRSLPALLWVAGCTDPAADNPFAPAPECNGPTVAYGKGDRTLVIAELQVAGPNQGFDLDRDGAIDNKLGVVHSLAAEPLEESFRRRHDVVIPLELFGLAGENSSCTKIAFYLGQFNKDRDGDGKDTNWSFDKHGAKGDCNDHDPEVRPGRQEVPDNRLDDNCDGYADNARPREPAADPRDLDGDGVSLAEGDCDDRPTSEPVMTEAGPVPLARLRHPQVVGRGLPAGVERCDGIDYDCDGIPDNAPACDPFGDANVALDVQRVSLDAMGRPLLVFRSGVVRNGLLEAGPDLFRISLELVQNLPLELELSGARVRGILRTVGDRTYLEEGLLGGVLQAVSLARLDRIEVKGLITPPQSLFDVIWAGGAVGTLLMLKMDEQGHLLPDMDVDRDGLETFWVANPNQRPLVVDTCRDGDGTIIRNGDTSHPNADPMRRCVFAQDAQGNYRFVDGISAALRFRAVPARLGALIDTLRRM
ncbi:MAG: putative metal-binding motif-containing protein [Myxococcota bacterium]|nr:putative metal-binding motif-containing protein [Myxococcota bacterium]